MLTDPVTFSSLEEKFGLEVHADLDLLRHSNFTQGLEDRIRVKIPRAWEIAFALLFFRKDATYVAKLLNALNLPVPDREGWWHPHLVELAGSGCFQHPDDIPATPGGLPWGSRRSTSEVVELFLAKGHAPRKITEKLNRMGVPTGDPELITWTSDMVLEVGRKKLHDLIISAILRISNEPNPPRTLTELVIRMSKRNIRTVTGRTFTEENLRAYIKSHPELQDSWKKLTVSPMNKTDESPLSSAQQAHQGVLLDILGPHVKNYKSWSAVASYLNQQGCLTFSGKLWIRNTACAYINARPLLRALINFTGHDHDGHTTRATKPDLPLSIVPPNHHIVQEREDPHHSLVKITVSLPIRDCWVEAIGKTTIAIEEGSLDASLATLTRILRAITTENISSPEVSQRSAYLHSKA